MPLLVNNNNNNNNKCTNNNIIIIIIISALEEQYIFQPYAVESLGPRNCDARKFHADLGWRISRVSGDDRETTFLFQCISVLLFQFNSVLVHNSCERDDHPEH